MACTKCGVELNRHAEKLVDPIDPREAAAVDPALGGILEEFYTCPECGKGEARRTS